MKQLAQTAEDLIRNFLNGFVIADLIRNLQKMCLSFMWRFCGETPYVNITFCHNNSLRFQVSSL